MTGGQSGSRQVVPRAWIEDIVENGDPAAWKKGDFFELFGGAEMYYRGKWYVARGDRPLVFGLGVFGQNVFVDPHADLVIAKFSSQPLPLDKTFLTLTLEGIGRLRELLG